MKATIHPYKGYLNTEFQLYSKNSQPTSFRIHLSNSPSDIVGILQPYIPQTVRIPIYGNHLVEFDDGTKAEIIVEDGYKFGGNKLKRAFVFDECPWAFIVMHDRTYFYNRKTEESYFEPISPDSIIEVADNFVIFTNNNQDEATLYSLDEQKPVLCVSNIEFFNKDVLCWVEQSEVANNQIRVFSINAEKIIHSISCDDYVIDGEKKLLYYHSSNGVYRVDLCSISDTNHLLDSGKEFITFLQDHYAVLLGLDKKSIIIYDLLALGEIGKIPVVGKLARVNNKEIINVSTKYYQFKKFNFDNFELPEATISCTYSQYDIHPCNWVETNEGSIKKGIKLFYLERISEISSAKGKYTDYDVHCFLKTINSSIEYKLIDSQGEISVSDRYFLFYNSQESIVIPRHYVHRTDYRKAGKIHKFKQSFLLQDNNDVYALNSNGFWEKSSCYNGGFDFSKYELFGLLIDKETKQCYDNNGTKLGKYRYTRNDSNKFVSIEELTRVYDGGRLIRSDIFPDYVSPSLKYGLFIDNEKILLGNYGFYVYYSKQILNDLYDTNQYVNVLLSENGHQVLYKENETSTMLDIETGQTVEFKNLSYINHINGIRPLIRFSETSQAILINPLDGQPIDFDLLTEYQFISPDKQLYADKALDKYIEYYDRITGKLITTESYMRCIRDFEFHSDNEEIKQKVKENRQRFVTRHYDFLTLELKKRIPKYENRSKTDIIDALLTYGSGRTWFTSLFIDVRGIAIIRRVSDNSEFAKIHLGEPLWFLNYVAFSKNSDYVAIAGRYPNGSNKGGLFLIYDLKNKKEVVNSTNSYAVWTAAFNPDGAVAAYTSDLMSFFAPSPKEYKNVSSDDLRIDEYSFLTFSPDGKYLACSQQRYIPYRKPDGEVRANWGHQPSSLVSIRSIQNHKQELVSFNDLSEMGIADAMHPNSIASVSFSNDNSRLMMVGKDGCIIIRNLHLTGYASE